MKTEYEDDVIDDGSAPWDERPIFGTAYGIYWWAAILLAVFLTAIGVAIDNMMSSETPTLITWGTYLVGCVAAIGLVRRRNVFGPMVQPPLVLVIVLVAAEFASRGMPDGVGMKDILLDYGLPVSNSFPAMAVATGVTVLLGVFRLLRERDPQRSEPARKPLRTREVDDDFAGASDPTRAVRPVGQAARDGRGRLAPPEPPLPDPAPRRRPNDTGARPRPQDSGPRRRPSDTGSRPRPSDTGSRPRPSETGSRRRPNDTGARPRPQDSGPRPRPLAREPRRPLPPGEAGPPPRREPPEPPRRSTRRPPPPRPRDRRWDQNRPS